MPDYHDDWQQALAVMQPGFTVLSDLTTVSDHLAELIVQAQQLVVSHEVRLVAAVHAPDSETHYASETVREELGLTMRTFTDLWQANKFLDELVAAETAI